MSPLLSKSALRESLIFVAPVLPFAVSDSSVSGASDSVSSGFPRAVPRQQDMKGQTVHPMLF